MVTADNLIGIIFNVPGGNNPDKLFLVKDSYLGGKNQVRIYNARNINSDMGRSWQVVDVLRNINNGNWVVLNNSSDISAVLLLIKLEIGLA